MEKYLDFSEYTFRLILIERDDGKRKEKSIKTRKVQEQMA